MIGVLVGSLGGVWSVTGSRSSIRRVALLPTVPRILPLTISSALPRFRRSPVVRSGPVRLASQSADPRGRSALPYSSMSNVAALIAVLSTLRGVRPAQVRLVVALIVVRSCLVAFWQVPFRSDPHRSSVVRAPTGRCWRM